MLMHYERSDIRDGDIREEGTESLVTRKGKGRFQVIKDVALADRFI